MAGDPVLFINSFINLRGPEDIGNIGRLEIDVSFVHLHTAMAACFHCHIYGHPHARPFGEGGISNIVKYKFLDARLLDRLLYLKVNHATRDR